MKEPQGKGVRAWPAGGVPAHHGVGVHAIEQGGMAETDDRPGRARGGVKVEAKRNLADDRLRGQRGCGEQQHDGQGRRSTHESSGRRRETTGTRERHLLMGRNEWPSDTSYLPFPPVLTSGRSLRSVTGSLLRFRRAATYSRGRMKPLENTHFGSAIHRSSSRLAVMPLPHEVAIPAC